MNLSTALTDTMTAVFLLCELVSLGFSVLLHCFNLADPAARQTENVHFGQPLKYVTTPHIKTQTVISVHIKKYVVQQNWHLFSLWPSLFNLVCPSFYLPSPLLSSLVFLFLSLVKTSFLTCFCTFFLFILPLSPGLTPNLSEEFHLVSHPSLCPELS